MKRATSNPLAPPHPPLAPPAARSRTALGLTLAAAEGRFALQRCAACASVQYPPREACAACLDARLTWQDVSPFGTLLAATTLRTSADPYFRPRMPWRIGIVGLDCGPSVIAHLAKAAQPGGRVRLALRLDKSGQGVMLALPEPDVPDIEDPIMRELGCDPRQRRVLVTDGRNTFGQEIARALAEADADVFVGIADMWKPFAGQARLAAPGIATIPLDLTDEDSVRQAAGEFGGRVDIVVNTCLHLRPGDVLSRRDTVEARAEMEAALFGPMRLAQAFGPALRARGADGTHPACAWVNVISAYALAPAPGFSAPAAAQAASLSLSHSLRAALRPLRVITVLVGPLDDVWHEAVPPPKVTPSALARAIVHALREGLEEVVVGDVARDLVARWKDNPAILARELAAG